MYHKLGIDEVLEALDVDRERGLSDSEARARHAEHGANEIFEKRGVSIFKSVLAQLNAPMIYILFVAAAISAIVGEWIDSIVILAIVVINLVIGVVQETKAERALNALRKLSGTHALVRRDGRIREIDASDLAVGDIVILEAGRIVPADLRIISNKNLTIDESVLTGESVPAVKDCEYISPGDVPIGDRKNSAYRGTVVTFGRGEGVVTATGMSTEAGQIADMLNNQNDLKTPIQARLARLGKTVAIASLSVCAVFFIIGLLWKENIVELFLTAISLAVAVIPEGLTAVVTIVLALGVTRMAERNAIVRKLPAVETLGSVTVICTDKTGTLTQNKMTVVEVYCDGKRLKAQEDISEALVEGLALCNNSRISDGIEMGDPTETALLRFARKKGKDIDRLYAEFPKIDELGFDSSRQMMTTLHRTGSTTLSYMKGALDSILMRSAYIFENGEIRALSEADREKIEAAATEMAGDALRVLALGMRSGDYGIREEKLVFVGLVGMIDPPRDEVTEAVEKCHAAGIRVVMITGDHRETAFAIGSAVNITKDRECIITGKELDKLSDEELLDCIENIRIFSRVDPKHKIRIVRALREKGHIVSMTGDGVNDAPSLKAADVGVAMGISGTDAARDASDIILTDDNFSTIAGAAEQGRNIFENIRKSVYFLFSSNMGEFIAVFFSMLLGWHSPLLPLHILWINLITDSLPALALGLDPGSPDVMKKEPRPADEEIFPRRGWIHVAIYGFICASVTLIMFKTAEIVTGSIELARTCAFATLAISQLFHSAGIRIGERSVFKVNHLENKFMIWAVAGGVLLTIAVLYIPPLAALFNTQAPGLVWLGGIFLASLVPAIAHEIEVLVMRAKRGQEK